MAENIKSYVGKKGLVIMRGLVVYVTIKDVKKTYGRDRYLITPVMGSGEKWVEKVELVAK
jgi:hypothetical protein